MLSTVDFPRFVASFISDALVNANENAVTSVTLVTERSITPGVVPNAVVRPLLQNA